MAVFKKYSPGYKKDGYYVHISIPSADHPIPLQTPDEIAEFYQSTGYNAGDRIPDQLVWTLYDLELHWTGEGGVSRSDTTDPKGDPAPKLDPEDIDNIQQYVDSYTGEYAEDLEQLVNRLKSSTHSQAVSEPDIYDLFERTPLVDFSTVSEAFSSESKRQIQRWLPSVVMDAADRKSCEELFDEEGIGISPHDHLVKLLQTPDYEALLESHATHPWPVLSVSIYDESLIESTADPSQPILTAEYETEQFTMENIFTFYVQDLRLYETQVDFEFKITTSTMENISVAISQGKIVDFSVRLGGSEPGRFDRDGIFEFATQYTDSSEASVTHSLAISFAHLLPEILEYCTEVSDYAVASTDPNTEYYEMTL
jgi:hypothetical protein